MENSQFEITSSLFTKFSSLKCESFSVHSVFDDLINFSNGNFLFSLSSKKSSSSLNISINNRNNFQKIFNSLTVENKLNLEFPFLYNNRNVFHLNNFKIINCKIDTLKLPDDSFINNFTETILTQNKKNSLIDIFSYNTSSDYIVKHFKYFHTILVESIKDNDLEKFQIILNNIVGLGRGLTPSGDDFLYGLLATWKTFFIKENYLSTLEHFIINNPQKFSLISFSFLSSLVDGYIFPDLKNLFLKISLKKNYTNEINNLINHGYSSGLDILAGVLTALKIK